MEKLYRWSKFPLTCFHPNGWLRRLLDIQGNGLSGHVGEVWTDLSSQSAWLSGNGEAWERGPYYLDGLIPLAWLTQDDKIINIKNKWIESILASRQEDGNFGPKRNQDMWPRLVVMKAMIEEYEASHDERIFRLLDGYAHFLEKNIDSSLPKFWAAARALEGFEALVKLQDITNDVNYDQLIRKLKCSMTDWFSYFADFPFIEPTTKYLPRVPFKIVKCIFGFFDEIAKKNQIIKKPESVEHIKAFNHQPLITKMMFTHGVNIAMALKYPVYYGWYINDTKLIELGKTAYSTIMNYHGTALGIHTSDEHLSGHASYQGTELCTIVEEMYAFEAMLPITKDPFFADRLDWLAFNALPAMISADMTKHQYVQQVNQIAADKKSRSFYDTNNEGNIFGLAPNYGCCLANMHQGFPKFARCQIFRTTEGIAVTGYAPISLSTTIDGEPLIISIDGDYPFSNTTTIHIHAWPSASTKLLLRIPELTKASVYINDKYIGGYSSGMVGVDQSLYTDDKINIVFDMEICSFENADGSISFRKGPILLAMPIESQETYLRGTLPFNDVEIKPISPWNLAPILKGGNLQIIKTIEQETPKQPFSRNTFSFEIRVLGTVILNWKAKHGSAGDIPKKIIRGEDRTFSLVPYGSTTLRIAAFPRVEDLS
jgi:hypothetical protein